jgi:hypothetical protein
VYFERGLATLSISCLRIKNSSLKNSGSHSFESCRGPLPSCSFQCSSDKYLLLHRYHLDLSYVWTSSFRSLIKLSIPGMVPVPTLLKRECPIRAFHGKSSHIQPVVLDDSVDWFLFRIVKHSNCPPIPFDLLAKNQTAVSPLGVKASTSPYKSRRSRHDQPDTCSAL